MLCQSYAALFRVDRLSQIYQYSPGKEFIAMTVRLLTAFKFYPTEQIEVVSQDTDLTGRMDIKWNYPLDQIDEYVL